MNFRIRSRQVLRPGLIKGPWTVDEDALIMACLHGGVTKWSEIASHVPGRIGKQCRERYFNHLDRESFAWCADPRWRQMCMLAPSETIALQWPFRVCPTAGGGVAHADEMTRMLSQFFLSSTQHLAPMYLLFRAANINKAPWSVEEDDLLESLQNEMGNRWSEIAKALPGRCVAGTICCPLCAIGCCCSTCISYSRDR